MNPMEQYMNDSMSGGSSEDKSNSGPLVEDEMSGKKSGKITFNQPAGFKMPEGVKDGESFDAMATLKMVNGKLVLDELDGTPVQDEHPGEEDSEEGDSDMSEDNSSEGDAESEPAAEENDSDKDEDSEPSTEEPEANDSGEPEDFLSAVEKKAKKVKK